ncbi:glycosyltransferase family 4 protein [Promineifilum sp.]|uniref:glycosyltransferase family 4 protein n=1 Tax=Promineifilum sp. TaxID=2664178 RepID=UPI0035B3A41B
MKKKIAYIGIKALPANQGVDTVVEKIVTRCDHDRFEPVVYVNRALTSPETEIPGVRLVRIPTLPGKGLNAVSLFLFSALHALFFGDYDLVNVHSVETCFILPILRLRYKVIATAHGLLSKEPAELSKWGRLKPLLRLTELPFMHLTSARTSVSKPDKLYLEAHYRRPVEYLPNGIDELRPDVDAARELLAQHGLEPGRYLIFTAGRVVPRKGCHFVLEALRQMDADVKLLVVGDTSHVPEYAAQLRALADDRVRFAGFISSKDLLFGLIYLSQLFVFPTTYEAMAITLLEVSALKTPLIASDIPENREVLPEQALFFRSADVADLRDKMAWALAHPDEMAALAARAHQRVGEQYRWPALIARYEELYEELIAARRGRPAAQRRAVEGK